MPYLFVTVSIHRHSEVLLGTAPVPGCASFSMLFDLTYHIPVIAALGLFRYPLTHQIYNGRRRLKRNMARIQVYWLVTK
jgi:hypothetical protein